MAARKRSPEYDAELRRAAEVLHRKLGYYLQKPELQAEAVEPLLRHWIEGHQARRQAAQLEKNLASAACQLLWHFRAGSTSEAFVREFVGNVAKLLPPARRWKDHEAVVADVMLALKRRERATDITRLDRILRAFEGLEPDSRRGVREDRAERLKATLAESPTLTKWRLGRT